MGITFSWTLSGKETCQAQLGGRIKGKTSSWFKETLFIQLVYKSNFICQQVIKLSITPFPQAGKQYVVLSLNLFCSSRLTFLRSTNTSVFMHLSYDSYYTNTLNIVINLTLLLTLQYHTVTCFRLQLYQISQWCCLKWEKEVILNTYVTLMCLLLTHKNPNCPDSAII